MESGIICQCAFSERLLVLWVSPVAQSSLNYVDFRPTKKCRSRGDAGVLSDYPPLWGPRGKDWSSLDGAQRRQVSTPYFSSLSI